MVGPASPQVPDRVANHMQCAEFCTPACIDFDGCLHLAPLGPSAIITFKRPASLLAEKSQIPYSVMINTIRCRLSFSLIKCVVMCICGAKSSTKYQLKLTIKALP